MCATASCRTGARAMVREMPDSSSLTASASEAGGVLGGRPSHRRRRIATAVLAASIFHFGEFTIREAKDHMVRAGLPMRLDP